MIINSERIKRKEIGNEIQSSTNYKYENVKTIIKKILMVSIPLTLSSIMTSFNKNIDSFTVVRGLKVHMSETAAKTTAKKTTTKKAEDGEKKPAAKKTTTKKTTTRKTAKKEEAAK